MIPPIETDGPDDAPVAADGIGDGYGGGSGDAGAPAGPPGPNARWLTVERARTVLRPPAERLDHPPSVVGRFRSPEAG